jgi:DsbC/DsbD-like thiol-disulfide interchange protein
MPRLFALLVVLLGGLPASAEPTTHLDLMPGWREEDGRYVAGLRIVLSPGWHTYWRSPGAAGIPPRFDWSGSRNLHAARVEWPHPQVFYSFGTRTIGYRNSVLLPILVEPVEPALPVDLQLSLDFGVCKEICMPARAEVSTRLLPEGGPGPARAMIERALSQRARAPGEAGVIAAGCSIVPNGSGLEVAATIRLLAPSERMTAVIEAASRPDLWIGAAEAATAGNMVTARARAEAGGAPARIDRRMLSVTLIEPGRFVEIEGCSFPD